MLHRISARRFGLRLVSMHAAILLVTALCAVTATLGLQSAIDRAEQRRTIDQRLALVDHIRADTIEIGRSARRFVLGGDLKERQRVQAITTELARERQTLRAMRLSPAGVALDESIDNYVALVDDAMDAEGEPIERLEHFEGALLTARNYIGAYFDRFITGERTRRDDLRSTFGLVRTARWAILAGAALAVLMIVMTSAFGLRRVQLDELQLQRALDTQRESSDDRQGLRAPRFL